MMADKKKKPIKGFNKKYDEKEPRFPVREWFGRYESFWLKMYGTKGFRCMDRVVDGFLGFHSAYLGLENFTMVEVTDYVQWRMKNGASPVGMIHETRLVRKFWNWCIRDKNLPLTNPVRRCMVRDLTRLVAPKPSKFHKEKVLPVPATLLIDTTVWDFGY
jgi:hypothetical protein